MKETAGDNAQLSNGEGDLDSYLTGHQPRDNKLEAVAINPNQVKGKLQLLAQGVQSGRSHWWFSWMTHSSVCKDNANGDPRWERKKVMQPSFPRIRTASDS